MIDAGLRHEKALSLEQQWAEAEEALRDCLTQICRDGPELRTAAMASPQTRARTKMKLPGKRLVAHGVQTLPRTPVDMLLGLLLRAMHAKFALDSEYRKNIKNFTADYVFTDKAAKICQVAHFANGKMRVDSKVPKNPTFTLTFSNGKALLALLFSPAPDVLDAVLNQKVDFVGNINYLNKFAYMALRAKPHF